MHRFVRESSLENVTAKPIKHAIAIEDGQTARIQYEQILQIPSTALITLKRHNKSAKPKIEEKKVLVPYDKNRLFHAATTNDMATIEQMNINNPILINATDQFGWTALMMAAYEGNLDVIKVLIRLGANVHIENNQNETAWTLAKRAKHHAIVQFLTQTVEPICLSSDDDVDGNDDDNDTKTMYFCDTCQMNVVQIDRKSHETSTLHRFNRTNTQSNARHFGIPDTNVGFQMLLQQGWNRDSGLGAQQNGIIYPIKTTLRKPRSGFGVHQRNKPKITHFKPFDRDAIKSTPSKPSAAAIASTRTKRQLRAERLRSERKDRYLRKLLS